MAKMFYTVEEAAEKLGKSIDEVTQMGKSGQIQEFRDREKLMFKKDQIDLLAGGGDEAGDVELIGLVDSGEQDALESKEESVLGLMDSKESTGLSVFDSGEMEAADPSAATQISDTLEPMEFNLDSAGSGSGLLDLTRESDDTSLGAVLDDIYTGGEDEMDQTGGQSGLFASGDQTAEPAPGPGAASGVMMAAPVAAYDGAGSGLAAGFCIGGSVCLLLSSLILYMALEGTLASLTTMLAENYAMSIGALGGGALLIGVIGWFIGKTFS